MQTSTEIGAIAAALAKAQGEMHNATKDTANTFFKSAYAPLDSVIDAIKAALAKNEIAYLQSPTNKGAQVSCVTRLCHSSGQWIETDPLEAQAKDGAPQSVGSAVTYLRRYSLMAAVGVAAADDDDGEAAHGREAPKNGNGNGNGRSHDNAAEKLAEREAKIAAEEKKLEAECIALYAKAQTQQDLDLIVPTIVVMSKAAQTRMRPYHLGAKKRIEAAMKAQGFDPHGDPEPAREPGQEG